MASDFFIKSGQADQELKWAKIWFGKLMEFLSARKSNRPDEGSSPANPELVFTANEVIAFLRFKRDVGMPAWKRMSIIRGLIVYRRVMLGQPDDDLQPLRIKMEEIIQLERARDEGLDSIEESVGLIDPSESDAIQLYRRALRKDGKKLHTERAYVGKVRAFMADRGLKTLQDFSTITGAHVEAHLTDLAVDGNVANSTQNASFHALLAFFKLVLKRDMGRIEAIRASGGKQVPTVMSAAEVMRVFDGLQGTPLTIAKLLYGCGMRISEAVRLRVKDLDFDNRRIEIHQAKGNKSRIVPMPEMLVDALRRQLTLRRARYDQDVAEGIASAWLPYAVSKKYPNANRELRWQYLFASDRISRDPRTGRRHRHHIHHDTFSVHLRRAVERSEITKLVTSHTFRHCFATHLLWEGTDIRKIQVLLGHSDVKTTMIYTHVNNTGESAIVSPLDRLQESIQTYTISRRHHHDFFRGCLLLIPSHVMSGDRITPSRTRWPSGLRRTVFPASTSIVF